MPHEPKKEERSECCKAVIATKGAWYENPPKLICVNCQKEVSPSSTEKEHNHLTCKDETCKWHGSKPATWEEEFDEIMSHLNWRSCICCQRYKQKIKPAIRNLLTSERNKSYEEGYTAALEKKYGLAMGRIIKATKILERNRLAEEWDKVYFIGVGSIKMDGEKDSYVRMSKESFRKIDQLIKGNNE